MTFINVYGLKEIKYCRTDVIQLQNFEKDLCKMNSMCILSAVLHLFFKLIFVTHTVEMYQYLSWVEMPHPSCLCTLLLS